TGAIRRARRWALAAYRSAHHRRNGDAGRFDPTDRIRALDHRVATGDRRCSTLVGKFLESGIRKVSAHSAVLARKPVDVAFGLQGDLLVGMDAPLSRTPARGRVLRSVRLVCMEGKNPATRLAAP